MRTRHPPRALARWAGCGAQSKTRAADRLAAPQLARAPGRGRRLLSNRPLPEAGMVSGPQPIRPGAIKELQKTSPKRGCGALPKRLSSLAFGAPEAPRAALDSLRLVRSSFLRGSPFGKACRDMQPCNIRHRDCSRGGPFRKPPSQGSSGEPHGGAARCSRTVPVAIRPSSSSGDGMIGEV